MKALAFGIDNNIFSTDDNHLNDTVEYSSINEGIHESADNNTDECWASFTCDVDSQYKLHCASYFLILCVKKKLPFYLVALVAIIFFSCDYLNIKGCGHM